MQKQMNLLNGFVFVLISQLQKKTQVKDQDQEEKIEQLVDALENELHNFEK